MIVENLPNKCFAAVGFKPDTRFSTWVKWVNTVDSTESTGYAFIGDFIKDGTIEVKTKKPRLILCCGAVGSRANHIEHYYVVRFDPDETLQPTELETTSQTKGWAIRLRDPMLALLKELDQTPPQPVIEIVPTALETDPIIGDHVLYLKERINTARTNPTQTWTKRDIMALFMLLGKLYEKEQPT